MKVVLLANYAADRQQSMLRYAEMMRRGLGERGIAATIWQPPVVLGKLSRPGRRLFKWLAYFDKYLLFPIELIFLAARRKLRKEPTVVHICDHSNAIYVYALLGLPCVATCHDVGAIRGALGELDDCPATGFGKLLQRAIAAGLRRIGAIACVSEATRQDLLRLVIRQESDCVRVIHNGLNQPFHHSAEETAQALQAILPGWLDRPYLLHVGSGLARKNRDGVLRVFAEFRKEWDGRLLFVGERLSADLIALRDRLGLGDAVQVVENPESLVLEGAYRHAFALLFPSRFEGFGWPVIEAQACGCPVLTTTVSALPEIAGEGACLRDPGDEAGFLADLRALRTGDFRKEKIERGRRNVDRFQVDDMILQFIPFYRDVCGS